jgi:CheY-like chemotaxis protein
MKVMVVDDEAAIRDLLSTVLTDEGYEVTTAAGGHEALERAPSERPDVMLVDLMMPGLDGRQLVRRMRELPVMAGVPTVMMSAAVRTMTLQEGVVDFLAKPFDLEELLEAIRKALPSG